MLKCYFLNENIVNCYNFTGYFILKMQIKKFTQTLVLIFFTLKLSAQNFPQQWQLSTDGHRLEIGKEVLTGIYDDYVPIKRVDFTFSQSNWSTLLTNNYTTKTNLMGTLTFDGIVYDSVGIRYKGQTSYSALGTSQKKSFNVELSWLKPAQDIEGYSVLNFNNAFEDPSFMREIAYGKMARWHIPAVKGNYVHLYINGQDWGLYLNVEQVNNDFYDNWFLSKKGTNWRADVPPGSGGGMGGGWGDGTAALNYLGTDTTQYKRYYTLKNANKPRPWDDLVTVCNKLKNTASASLRDTMDKYMDLDRTLWFLASENIYTDDDSYIFKGKMDYYVYREWETGRTTPQEFDGNSAFYRQVNTTWGPFYNANNANYPLLNKLLAVAEIRQRYLAHYRTILNERFNTTVCSAYFDYLDSQINALVQADPKKIYTYAQYTSELTTLKNNLVSRRNYLLSNTEVAQVGPTINVASHFVNNVEWQRPTDQESPLVKASVTSTNGISAVNLYYCNAIVGKFTKVAMYDDGLHNDGNAGDGVYAANIPAFAAATWVRYYVEAIGNNTAKSASYNPAGAEHDVYVYFIQPNYVANSPIVINEIMASNSITQADEAGEFDDWIELYNRGTDPVDISAYHITDETFDLSKFDIPNGTIMPPNSYLILWADEDGIQGNLHCNFKLSSTGESLMLLNGNYEVLDEVNFSTQTLDMGYARIPNGTGNFVIKEPTFNANNETNTGIHEIENSIEMSLFPNPTRDYVMILLHGKIQEKQHIQLFNMQGQKVLELPFSERTRIDLNNLPNGVYTVSCANITKRLIVSK